MYVIENDLFDIVDRVKAIDEKYYIVRNFVKHRYELHYDRKQNTLELVIPFDKLDSRTVDLVLKTRIENRKKLLEEMDKQNKKLEQENIKQIEFTIKEIQENMKNKTLRNLTEQKAATNPS